MPAMVGRAVLLCLLAWLLAGSTALAEPQSHAELPCAGCHLEGSAGTAPGALRAPQERLCAVCHEGASQASHPSGFTPGRPLPAGFPLDAEGRMTCSTCHATHGPEQTASLGQGLCLACHERAFFAEMADRGHSLFPAGHLAAGIWGGRGMSASTTGEGATVDRYTLGCLRCHDDRFTAPGGRMVRAAYGARNGTGMANHPVGVDYATPANSLVALRPRALLPDQVLLPEGRVSCLSCHQAYTREHGALVAADRGVCLNCHDM